MLAELSEDQLNTLGKNLTGIMQGKLKLNKVDPVIQEELNQKNKLTLNNMDEAVSMQNESAVQETEYHYVTLQEDYYNLAVFAFFMREKHIDEEINFEMKYNNT